MPTPSDPPAARVPAEPTGEALHAFVAAILPHRRCLTGDGLRDTLAHLGQVAPVETTEVLSGTAVLDWVVPDEWRVRDAYLAGPSGRRFAEWSASPLHLVQYSRAVRARMPLADLRPHLHTLPERPHAVPYRTAYYADPASLAAWGFCLAHNEFDALMAEVGERGQVEVVIDADHVPGSLTLGEVVVPGETDRELLVSAHACHPALANDNAASLAVAVHVARALLDGPRPRHTVRFVFAPGTLGAIAWLALNRARWDRIAGGLVLANLGDRGPVVYKQTRAGTFGLPALTDRAAAVALRDTLGPFGFETRPFTPTGYDERQFGSPGVDLPVGRLTRTPPGEYPEYHTSDDDLRLVDPEALLASFRAVLATLRAMDRGGERFENLAPEGEPQLGRRGLYAPTGGAPRTPEAQEALLWVLTLADGRHDLLHAAAHSSLPFPVVAEAADRLLAATLLRR